MKKRIVILGSTGSIGKSTLDVIARNSEHFEVFGMSAHSSVELFAGQIDKFKPKFAFMTDNDSLERLKSNYKFDSTQIIDSQSGLDALIESPADIILNAIVGAAGLRASLDTVKAGKRLALANKESMVIGGELINSEASKSGAEIIPVDSEHSAIWQSLYAGKKNELKKIILTGSGGPFRELPLDQFGSITKEQALNHPTWNMGAKITIDSATMMNKGLEVIEAVHLFKVEVDKIDVVIHPQSVVHSMVEYIDSSIIAQISNPDMRLPILYALTYPDRIDSNDSHIDLADVGTLTFEKPDYRKFRLLKTAFDVINIGGTASAVYNAANEVAVASFLNDKIEFGSIPDVVMNALDKHDSVSHPALDEILEADNFARETADKFCRKISV